jgi:hypothetical protein
MLAWKVVYAKRKEKKERRRETRQGKTVMKEQIVDQSIKV